MDLSKLSVEAGSSDRPTDPQAIFAGLTLRGTIENVWGPQQEALTAWHTGRDQTDTVLQMNTGGGKTLVLSGTALIDVGSGSWSLVADSGIEQGQVIPIVERVEIGRALECDISILEPALSRKHAELEPDGDTLVIRDLGSHNGTYVNGSKVDEVELKDGDRLQFDKVKFIVSSPS